MDAKSLLEASNVNSAMRTGLSQKQQMLQKLSPQQIQLKKLLQIPTANLEQRIKEELEANPALDEGNDEVRDEFADNQTDERLGEAEDSQDEAYELDDYLNDYIEDDPSSYKLRANNYSADEEDNHVPIAVEQSFHEYLEQQLGLLELTDEKEEAIAHQIIGSIDEDGYLRRDPISIVDDLMFSQNIFASEEEVKRVLQRIQQLDPPGTAARDLQECLLLQLEAKLEQDEEEADEDDQQALRVAHKMLSKYFDGFSKKHYEKLQRQLGIDTDELRAAMDEILKLNPKPASAYSSASSDRAVQYIVPDFIIENQDGELVLTLNQRNAPELHISDHFRHMLQDYGHEKAKGKLSRSQKDAFRFVRQKVESARWFIDAIRQRYETMYKTMYAILQYQYDYFLTGDQKKIRPMILQDVADITGLDVSTVSRVANSKYVQTEFGTRRLKDFFSESMQTNEGEEVSTLQVKKILSEIVAKENKRKPLSDEKLKNLLREEGYKIARRTVAKYREQLGIPKASLRKEL